MISISNLSYAYPALHPADEIAGQPDWVLQDINLTIQAGEFVAVMGPTGVGKTTFCLALNGIVPHLTGGTIRGDVLIDGKNTKQQRVPDLARQVGLIFQEPEAQLFNASVEDEVAFGLENLGLLPQEIEERVAWSLSVVEMDAYRRHSPVRLSGGQQKRVAIASVLAMLPAVIVLDEPTANLDPRGVAELIPVLSKLSTTRGITVVMASHESEALAEFCSRVVVLSEGGVVLDGTPAGVFSRVSRLHEIGLDVPQVSELALELNRVYHTHHDFYQLGQAQHTLAQELDAQELGTHFTYPHDIDPQKLGPVQTESSPAAAFCLQTQGLCYAYEAGTPVLQDISLAIPEGSFVAITGLNGSGKTTLARHFNGLLRPQRGTVRLFGEDTRDRPIGELARTVGYVFQNPDHQIFSSTVRQEIAFGLHNLGWAEDAIESRTAAVLDAFDLAAYAGAQPAALSFGLRRKISIAAVYAMSPRVLILDEPTTGLDRCCTQELMAILDAYHQAGNTILFITHDMRLVAGRIPHCLVLHRGRVLFHGETRTFFRAKEIVRQAHLDLPQITRLAELLAPHGLSSDILSVAEFLDAYGSLGKARGEGRDRHEDR